MYQRLRKCFPTQLMYALIKCLLYTALCQTLKSQRSTNHAVFPCRACGLSNDQVTADLHKQRGATVALFTHRWDPKQVRPSWGKVTSQSSKVDLSSSFQKGGTATLPSNIMNQFSMFSFLHRIQESPDQIITCRCPHISPQQNNWDPLLLWWFQLLSHVQLFAIPWTVACQAPLSIAFSRQEYWSGLPFPPPGDLPNPGTEPRSSALAGRFFTTEPPGKPSCDVWLCFSPSPLGYSVSPDPL